MRELEAAMLNLRQLQAALEDHRRESAALAGNRDHIYRDSLDQTESAAHRDLTVPF